MQRVSSLLPSWDKRASTPGSSTQNGSGSGPVPPAVGPPPAVGGGFFAWSKRSSSASAASSIFNRFSYNDASNAKSNTANGNGAIANRHSTQTVANNRDSVRSIQTRIQREAFWPATLDLECDKAARIIKSFCADGFLAPVDDPASASDQEDETDDEKKSQTDGDADAEPSRPKTPVRVPKKIPKRIIQNAAAIAVFTCMRSGLYMTGSGGSGILIARKSDGTWSPPSGIMLHTPTLSFILGVDVYDCVLVITSLSALESITRSTVTLGEDVGLTAGPLTALDASTSPFTSPTSATYPGGSGPDAINLRELDNTVLTYMKSRGQSQSVNMHGCILTERANENERFYESPVSQMDVLAGNVARNVDETKPLFEVIKLAEGRTDFDPTAVAKIAIEPAPGDANIASPTASAANSALTTPLSPRSPFGMPQADDPDPFGVLALEMAGMEIREAGASHRPASSQLELQQAAAAAAAAASSSRPFSSALSSSKRYNRQSGDTFISRSNRESYMSSRTVRSQMTDAHTQTTTATTAAGTPETSPSTGHSEDGHAAIATAIKEGHEGDDEEHEVDYTTVDTTPIKHLSQPRVSEDTRASSIDDTAAAAVAVDADANKLALPANDDDADKISKASSYYEDSDANNDDKASDNGDDDGEGDEDEDDDEEEPVVFEVAEVQPTRTQAVASRMISAKGSMVTIPRRVPPPLPRRNPARASVQSRGDLDDSSDAAHSIRSPLASPLYQEFSAASDMGTTEDERSVSAGFQSPEPATGDDDESPSTPLPRGSDDNDNDEEVPETPVAKTETTEQAGKETEKTEEPQNSSASDLSAMPGGFVTTPAEEAEEEEAAPAVPAAEEPAKEEPAKEEPAKEEPAAAEAAEPAKKEESTPAAEDKAAPAAAPAEDNTQSRVSTDSASGTRSSVDMDSSALEGSAAYTTPSTSEHFPSSGEDDDKHEGRAEAKAEAKATEAETKAEPAPAVSSA